jgi:hypothetical protein
VTLTGIDPAPLAIVRPTSDREVFNSVLDCAQTATSAQYTSATFSALTFLAAFARLAALRWPIFYKIRGPRGRVSGTPTPLWRGEAVD